METRRQVGKEAKAQSAFESPEGERRRRRHRRERERGLLAPPPPPPPPPWPNSPAKRENCSHVWRGEKKIEGENGSFLHQGTREGGGLFAKLVLCPTLAIPPLPSPSRHPQGQGAKEDLSEILSSLPAYSMLVFSFLVSPVCSTPESSSTVGVATLETAQLLCDVDAFPMDLSFHWRFESSAPDFGAGAAKGGANASRGKDVLDDEDYDLVGIHSLWTFHERDITCFLFSSRATLPLMAAVPC